MHGKLVYLLITALLFMTSIRAGAQDRETKVRQDRERFQEDERWIYNRLDWAFDEALKTGKPMLVVFRCIPCEACSEFDNKVIEEQEGISDLLDRFVCVRIVQANGLDLNLFQFDYDQSFHAILMNADRTIYGRFGTRSSRPEDEDMTMDGFRSALEKALEWHANYPSNKELFAAKKQAEAFVDMPEQFPSLKGKYTSKLDYEGNVVQSCIHCHQIRDAQRMVFRDKREQIPDHILFPYPLPDVIGVRIDPHTSAKVADVKADSMADRAGLRADDMIVSFAGQPILSTADIQWVLHNAPATAEIEIVVQRGDDRQQLKIDLEDGWRVAGDISFRPTSWDLRRMATGGLLLKDATDEQRQKLKISNQQMALIVEHVGEYGEHATAKNAGFKNGDIVVEVNGQARRMTESQFIHYAIERSPGSKLNLTVLREGRKMKFSFATQ